MKKIILAVILCITLAVGFTACGDDEAEVEPVMANAVISGDGSTKISEDSEGNSVIENLKDGNYVEWIVTVEEDGNYSAEVEYSQGSDGFVCGAEVYSEDGKLQVNTDIDLGKTGGADEYKSASGEIGQLTAGMYTFILRPGDGAEAEEAVNIRSLKLTLL